MATAEDHPDQRRIRLEKPLLLLVAVAGVIGTLALARTGLISAPVLILAAFVPVAWIVVAGIDRIVVDRVPLHFTNSSLPDRIHNLTDMLCRARREIVIVTGSLNHRLYADPQVVNALQRVPRNVKIVVIRTGEEFDRESAEFIELLRRRHKVKPMATQGASIKHALVIDKRDAKLEEAGVRDDAEFKCADYYYNDRSVARAILKQITALKTRRVEFPAPAAKRGR